MKIYHIVNPQDWEEGTEAGKYRTSTLEKDGFIHCCKEDQIGFVVNNWFSGQTELFLITIEADKLETPLIFENSETGEEAFPHIYGPINLDAVVDIQPLDMESR
jgi:uncharacterized protein (DUF952 family)